MIRETWEDQEEVQLIMQCLQNDINTADTSGETILFKSSSENHTHIVRILLGNPYLDVNKGTADGTTALHIASRKENNHVIQMLLSHSNLEPNHVNNNYSTALMEASGKGYKEVVKLLLRHPTIDVNKVNLARKSALFFASEKGKKEVVMLLLRCPTTDTDLHDTDDNIAADYAKSYIETLQSFEDRARLIATGHTCCSKDMKKGLQISSKSGDLHMTKALMKCNGMDLNNGYGSERTPLYIASRENRFDIVETLLLDSRIDVNRMVNGENALLTATEEGHADIVRILLEHDDIDTNIGKSGNEGSALFIAAESGNSEIVKDLLLQPQIEVNSRHKTESITPLVMASRNGYLNVVKMLLRCSKTQVEINKLDIFEDLDDNGRSMIDILRKSKHTCCLSENKGLLKAAISGDYRALKGLGQCPKADINTVDAKGRTPLYLATWFGHKKAIAELLNQKNLDFDKGRSLDGMTPLSIASQKGHAQIMRLLIEHSNNQNTSDVDSSWQSDKWTKQSKGVEFPKHTTATSIYSTQDGQTTGEKSKVQYRKTHT